MFFSKTRLLIYGLSFTFLLLGIILFGQNGYAQGTRILRTPTVSSDAIAFVHAKVTIVIRPSMRTVSTQG